MSSLKLLAALLLFPLSGDTARRRVELHLQAGVMGHERHRLWRLSRELHGKGNTMIATIARYYSTVAVRGAVADTVHISPIRCCCWQQCHL